MNFFSVGTATQGWAKKSQIPVWYEAETTSTNLIAKENPLAAGPICLYLTDHQTHGRGRGHGACRRRARLHAACASTRAIVREFQFPSLEKYTAS